MPKGLFLHRTIWEVIHRKWDGKGQMGAHRRSHCLFRRKTGILLIGIETISGADISVQQMDSLEQGKMDYVNTDSFALFSR